MPDTVQRIFASAWTTAVADADARYQSDRDTALQQGDRRLAAEALESEQTRTRKAREALAVLQERAAAYWNKTETPTNRGTEG